MTKIMPVEQCGAIAKMSSNAQQAASSMSTWGQRSKTAVATYALQRLETAMQSDRDVHEKNRAALEANKAVRERIVALMDEIGMPKTRRVRDGNRTRYGMPKMKTIDAGYLEDMGAHVPISDGFERAEQRYAELKVAYEKFAEEARVEAERAKTEAERAAEREKERRRENIEMAKIILRYDLDEDCSWGDILGELRKKDQRLDLAVAMQQTRGDWSEGFWRVSDALSRFKIETDEDKEIANDVVQWLNGDHDDGRVFRDTAWNYDRLFGSASDQRLAADVQRAAANAEDH